MWLRVTQEGLGFRASGVQDLGGFRVYRAQRV